MPFRALFMGFKGKISKGGYFFGNTQFALLEIKLYAVWGFIYGL